MNEPESSHSETMLQIHAFQRGDHSVAGPLFARYYPIVRRIVALRIGRTLREFADQDDVVQEALLDAFEHLNDFELRGEGSFRHWLAQLVQNRFVSMTRKERAGKRGSGRVQTFRDAFETGMGTSQLPGGGPTPSQFVHASELEAQREAALLSLTEFHRELINLRENCEMTFAEISGVMELNSADAARMAYKRAVTKVSDLLLARESEGGADWG